MKQGIGIFLDLDEEELQIAVSQQWPTQAFGSLKTPKATSTPANKPDPTQDRIFDAINHLSMGLERQNIAMQTQIEGINQRLDSIEKSELSTSVPRSDRACKQTTRV